MLPQLQHSLQHLQVRILLQVVSMVKAAWPTRLHVGYSLVLDGPWIRGPAVAVHVQGVCVLHHHTHFLSMSVMPEGADNVTHHHYTVSNC